MIFEFGDAGVIAPLDPREGDRYVESVWDELDAEALHNIYK